MIGNPPSILDTDNKDVMYSVGYLLSLGNLDWSRMDASTIVVQYADKGSWSFCAADIPDEKMPAISPFTEGIVWFASLDRRDILFSAELTWAPFRKNSLPYSTAMIDAGKPGLLQLHRDLCTRAGITKGLLEPPNVLIPGHLQVHENTLFRDAQVDHLVVPLPC